MRKALHVNNDKFYILPSKTLIKTHKVDIFKGKVFFVRYDEFRNDVMDLDIAERTFQPIYKIGEVARMLGKSPATLRVYEHQGLLSEAKRYKLSAKAQTPTRFYTEKDIWDLVEFFDRRSPVGRPSKNNKHYGVNKKLVKERLERTWQKAKSQLKE